ncbi:hypothetical protein D3C81_1278420 [compost metagenome]
MSLRMAAVFSAERPSRDTAIMPLCLPRSEIFRSSCSCAMASARGCRRSTNCAPGRPSSWLTSSSTLPRLVCTLRGVPTTPTAVALSPAKRTRYWPLSMAVSTSLLPSICAGISRRGTVIDSLPQAKPPQPSRPGVESSLLKPAIALPSTGK